MRLFFLSFSSSLTMINFNLVKMLKKKLPCSLWMFTTWLQREREKRRTKVWSVLVGFWEILATEPGCPNVVHCFLCKVYAKNVVSQGGHISPGTSVSLKGSFCMLPILWPLTEEEQEQSEMTHQDNIFVLFQEEGEGCLMLSAVGFSER